MLCPFCHVEETKVIDSRLMSEGFKVRRRRECLACLRRFTTFEVTELTMPRVIKRNTTRVPYDEQKIRNGLLKALEKRSVNADAIDRAVLHIQQHICENGEREITSQQIGEWVMQELKALDQVAYVRFASVYRSFQDVEEFHQEIAKLQIVRSQS